MPNWNKIVREQLAELRLPPEREIEIVEELALHLETAYEDGLADSLSPAEAEGRALRSYDWRLLECEVRRAEQSLAARALQPPLELIERRGRMRMESIIQDISFGARMLMKNRGFALIAVLTLALSIGANISIFSIVNAVLLRPLPLPEPDRLVSFWHSAPAKGLPEVLLNDALFDFYRDRSQMFEKMAVYEGARSTLTGAGEPELLIGARVSFNYFNVLGQEPLYGRAFMPQEEMPGKDDVAILSYGLWQQRFGADRRIVGQAIKLDNRPMVVVGIMPPSFDFPNPGERVDLAEHIQFWVPYGLNPQNLNSWNLSAIGRLKPGITPANAQREIASLWDDFARQYKAQLGAQTLGAGATTVVMPLARRIVREVRTPILALLGAVAFVLLIACANLANLMLARAASRGRELAVRQCLGASVPRIARQLLTEIMLLALLGGVGGLLLAAWSIGVFRGLLSESIPGIELLRLDWTVLLFTLAVTLLAGALSGLAPALRSGHVNLQEAIKEGSRGSSSGSNRRLNNAFVLAQLALSLVLLIGAALLLQSFKNLLAVDPGFRAENVLMGKISLPGGRYINKTQVSGFYEQLLERVRSLAGVLAAESTQVAPFSGDSLGATYKVEDQGPKVNPPAKAAQLRDATPGYFAAMGMPILKGRSFQPTDTEASPPVAIVDEKLARGEWPNEDPLGKRIAIGGSPMMTIVGVVPSVKNRNLNEEIDPYVYRPAKQFVRWETTLIVRTAIDPKALIPAIRQQVASLDPELPLYHVSTIEQGIARSLSAKRLIDRLFTGFTAMALLLALLGVYGVMSLNVGSRTNEFGIRLALGARRTDLLWLVVGEGIRLVLLGVALGLGGAFGLTRLLEALLFGVKASDQLIFAGAAVMMSLAALAACYIPARRAMKVDPLIALRQD
jgi:putative ABC transport system permease protein